MSAFEDGSYSSVAGTALIAKALSGRCGIRYTRAAVGKGRLPEGSSPKTAAEPPGYVMDARIANVTVPKSGECNVEVQINSSDVEHGFFATCILLYAEDPDEGEVPFTYLFMENAPKWIRPSDSAVGKLASFELTAAVGDADRVTAVLDPESIVTRETAQQMIDAAVPGIEIGSIMPERNNVLWFDTSNRGSDRTLKVNMVLVSDSSKEIKAEIDNTLYGVENAGSGEDSELNLTIY